MNGLEFAAVFCAECKERCEKEGKQPECYRQYGPCEKYLDEMELIESEVQE